jgi:hypothetical protein
MKKLLWPMVAVIIGLVSVEVHACASTDIMCYVVSAVQKFRVDRSGNLTVAGTSAVTGASTFTGAVTNSSNVTTVGKSIQTPQLITGVSSTTTLSPTGTYVQLASTGGLVTVGQATGNAGQTYYPAIATATATSGQYVLFFTTGTSGVVISTGAGLGSNNGVEGSSAFLSTVRPKVLEFIFDSANSMWREVHD